MIPMLLMHGTILITIGNGIRKKFWGISFVMVSESLTETQKKWKGK